jgi:hypothetical protein
VLEINGISVLRASHKMAADLLKNAGAEVSLRVVHNPEGFRLFTEEARHMDDTFEATVVCRSRFFLHVIFG